MNFPMLLKSNENSLNIKFGNLQQGFLNCVIRKNKTKRRIKNNLKLLEKNLPTEENECLDKSCLVSR